MFHPLSKQICNVEAKKSSHASKGSISQIYKWYLLVSHPLLIGMLLDINELSDSHVKQIITNNSFLWHSTVTNMETKQTNAHVNILLI